MKRCEEVRKNRRELFHRSLFFFIFTVTVRTTYVRWTGAEREKEMKMNAGISWRSFIIAQRSTFDVRYTMWCVINKRDDWIDSFTHSLTWRCVPRSNHSWNFVSYTHCPNTVHTSHVPVITFNYVHKLRNVQFSIHSNASLLLQTELLQCTSAFHSISFHFGSKVVVQLQTAECYYIQLKCLCHWINGLGSVGLNCVQVPEIRAIANHQRSRYEFFVHCLLMPWVEYVLSTATITTTNRSTSHQHEKSNRISLSFLSFIQSFWLLWCDVWDIEKL